MTTPTTQPIARSVWNYTIETNPEGYTFTTWHVKTGETIIFGGRFYVSRDACIMAMTSAMIAAGYAGTY